MLRGQRRLLRVHPIRWLKFVTILGRWTLGKARVELRQGTGYWRRGQNTFSDPESLEIGDKTRKMQAKSSRKKPPAVKALRTVTDTIR
jgi:hypothetical protein